MRAFAASTHRSNTISGHRRKTYMPYVAQSSLPIRCGVTVYAAHCTRNFAFITDWNACFVLRSLICISSCSRLARRLVVLGLWYVQHIKCICFHVHFRSWSISGWSRCFYGILFSLRCHESAYVDVSKVHGFDECFSVSSSWNSSLPCASFWCCISATVKDATISISNLTKVGSSNSGGNYTWFNRSATSKSHNISTT